MLDADRPTAYDKLILGIVLGAEEREAGTALIALLPSPSAAPVIRKSGR
jgi:hypothetical protein